MNERLPSNSSEVPENTDTQVDIEIEIDPATYIVGAQEKPVTQADQGVMVGDNLIIPATAGRKEHIYLPLGEETVPVNTDVYNRMVGGRNNKRPDISI